MESVFHITSGDIAGGILAKAGLPGEVFVWHDLLYEGPRRPGWPDDQTLSARARFLQEYTAGGLDSAYVLETLRGQYQKLAAAADFQRIVLWFDACLFDQSMLAHILTCLDIKGIRQAELLCVDSFPGIEPFHGLGQLGPDQLASLYDTRRPVTADQFRFAALVDQAFATQDLALLNELSEITGAPLPWVPGRGQTVAGGTARPGNRFGVAGKPGPGRGPGRPRHAGRDFRVGGRRGNPAAILGGYDPVGQDQRAGGPCATLGTHRGTPGPAAAMGKPGAAQGIQDHTWPEKLLGPIIGR